MDKSDKLFFGTIVALFLTMTGHPFLAFWLMIFILLD